MNLVRVYTRVLALLGEEAKLAWLLALANLALDRALADDPRYSMALLLRQVITAGAPPSLARLPMTPEEVAASYDDAGDDHDEDGDQDLDMDDQDPDMEDED